MWDIGTLTGATGILFSGIALIISIKAYRQASSMKALDLRLELQKTHNELDILAANIDGHLGHVFQSHQRVLAATGRNGSGEMQWFEADYKQDQAKLLQILGAKPKREMNIDLLTPALLESQLVSAHYTQTQLIELRKKYSALFESDEERRKEIRAAHAIPPSR